MSRKQGIIIAIAVIALGITFLPRGCEDKEAQLTLKTLNEDVRLLNRGVQAKKITFTERHHDGVREYDADLFNDQGNVVGKAEGRRVEGFGTMRPRLEWSDPALADKSFDPQQNVNQAFYDKIMKADANGDGKVTYEEAVAANPHLMRTAFEYLDRNGDGVVSQEDLTFKGPPRMRTGPFGRRRNPPPDS